MPYNCPTWEWETDGFKKGPRHAPMLERRFQLQGRLRTEEVHASLQSRLRVLLVTHLAVKGSAETPALARAMGTKMDRIGTKLRGLQSGGLVDCRRMQRKPGRIGIMPREWRVTEAGRWSLWRQGWLTRSALCPSEQEWPADEQVADDPVEAVRLHVREEFLRPGSYRALAWMMTQGLVSSRETAIALGIAPPIIYKRMQWWKRLGWVEQTRWPARGFQDTEAWCWLVTDAGRDALFHHADALRRAALACGWSPTPGAVEYGPGRCQYHYEEEFLEMGWRL